MAGRDDLDSFLGTRYFVGLSAVLGITVIPGQNATVFKHGGGGTMYAGGSSVAVGLGYLMATGEAISANASGTMYFVAAGSTATLYTLFCRTAGFNP